MTVAEFLLDSNILIYNYDTSDLKKHTIAKNLVDKCWKKEQKFSLSTQNLSEFFSVVTSKKILTKKEAAKILSDIVNFSGWKKIKLNHKTVLEAARISDEHNMSYWDSLLAATMRQNGVFNIYTENVQDFKVRWLNAVNPFSEISDIKKSRGIAKGVTTEDLRDESDRFD